jgi:predicted CoA-binding protein
VTAWANPGAPERLAILRAARSVAVMGASANPNRASYFVATYLVAETPYDLYFVNPSVTEILGRQVWPSLDSLPVAPDIVDVFRRREDLGTVTDEAIAAGAGTVWFQLGLRDDTASQRAHDKGLNAVADRCLKIEHARFKGGLHLAGFDTGVLSSRRRPEL